MEGALTIHRLRRRRRKAIKRFGKRAFRRLNAFLATQSTVPTVPVLDPALFPWVAELAREWTTMRDELGAVLDHRAHLPHLYEISKDNGRISADHRWKTFLFHGFGYRSEHNCRLCPRTAALLRKVPRLETAFFSILAPGAVIPPHQGIAKGLLRCHLPLLVPERRADCWMRLADETIVWEAGRPVVFDDTYTHEVRNDTDQDRVVLLFDFERPMRPAGRWLGRALLAIMHRTGYVQDARQNYHTWEERLRRALEDA